MEEYNPTLLMQHLKKEGTKHKIFNKMNNYTHKHTHTHLIHSRKSLLK